MALILVGISSFIVSVIIAIMVVSITYRLFSSLLRSSDKDDIVKGNTAMAIAVAGDLVAFGLLMAQCLYPASAVLQNLFSLQEILFKNVLLTLGYIAAYFVIGYALSVLTVYLSTKVFQMMTPSIEEIRLLKENNIAAAIILSGIVITAAIMVQSGLADLLNTMIPQMNMGAIRVQ